MEVQRHRALRRRAVTSPSHGIILMPLNAQDREHLDLLGLPLVQHSSCQLQGIASSLFPLLWFHPPHMCRRWSSCILFLLLLKGPTKGMMWPCKRHCLPYRATLGLGRGLTIRKVSACAKIPPSHSLRSKPSLNQPPTYVFIPTV